MNASQPALMDVESGGERATSSEQFWVPDEILMKKRAQSLMPQLLIPHETYTRGGEFFIGVVSHTVRMSCRMRCASNCV